MEDLIRLLPDSIANQIAAGEVVQRPASVVKELMENAIDAESSHIRLIIKDAGKTLIQVIDNGLGMSETDARMSFERHATSKIKNADDLFKIRTMGFRGEALASIAAVAQVEMRTQRAEDQIGTRIYIEASKLISQEAITGPKGTSVSVKNLFYNVPARRNFLRSNQVEMRHILDEFYRIALAHPDLSLQLIHNELEVFQLSPSKLSQRIVSIFGKNYQKQLAYCAEETPLLKIQGYIGKPEYAKKTRGEQFFFVNQRYIRHAYLHHAVTSAFEDLIPQDSFPFYVLYLEVDPQHIDINIHPTKTEVKFDDERTFYALIQAAVKKVLSMHHISPSLDFETDVNFELSNYKDQSIQENQLYQGSVVFKDKKQPAFSGQWEELYASLKNSTLNQTELQQSELEFENYISIESKANSPKGWPQQVTDWENAPILQIQRSFFLLQVADGILLVHRQRALERIFFDQFSQNNANKKSNSQQLLFPHSLEMNAGDFQLFLEIADELANLGFDFDILPNHTLQIKGLPSGFSAHTAPKALIEEFIEHSKKAMSEIQLDQSLSMKRFLAKKAAAQSESMLIREEIASLIQRLCASSQPNYTPDGKPVFVHLPMDQLHQLFNKPSITE